MELFIDTAVYGRIKLQLMDRRRIVGSVEKRTDKISESLIPQIHTLLRKHGYEFQDLTRVYVNPGPGGFSSTRTGVATANVLNFVLGNNEVVLPKYDKQPNITIPHRK